MIVRAVAGTALLLLALSLGLAVGVPAALADSSPVLVIVAHPDDETLGAAGVIESALAAGRPVYVAVVTNGATAGSAGSSSTAVCGAATGTPSGVALLGLTRERESESALAYLGGGTTVGTGLIPWTNSLVSTHVVFLGYPDGGGTTSQGIAGISQGLSVSDDAGIGTYADSGDSTNHNCNGDYHFLRFGTHGSFTQASLQGDISDVIDQVRPGDIYTHVVFDGHPDHAAVARDVLQAVQTLGLTTTVHGTLIHHLEQAGCLAASAWFWPNPEQVSDPAARATPSLPFLAPPLFAGAPSSHCPASTSDTPVGSDWGPWGAPNEIDPVPADMALTDLTQNHKWQAISKYHTQMSGCPANVASCGYLYAFIKSDEFFWTYSFGAAAKPAPLSWPGISGTGHAVGNTLTPNHATAADGTWANAPTGYAYQWVRCDPVGELTSCSDIAGATGPGAYTLVNADAGSTLRIKVTASNGNGSTTIWSEATDVITGGTGSPPVNTGLPVVSGSLVSGQVLSVSNGSWTGSPAPSFAYQWQRCDGGGAGCVAIGGATSQTYTLVAADVGHTMRAVVTGSNTAGSSAASSAQTVVVTGPPSPPVNTGLPVVSGSLVSGQVLSVSNGSWTGSPAPSFAYQWQRCDGGGAGCVAIGGATGQSYTLVAADVGHTMRAVVTGSNTAGSSAATSAATGVVTAGGGGGTGGGGTGGGGGGGGGGTGGGGGGGSGVADLRLEGSVDPVQAGVGDTVTWRITVNDYNTGPATGLWVDVQLPSSVSLVSSYADRGTGCIVVGDNKLHCYLDWLADNVQFGHVILVTKVTATGDHVLTAVTGYVSADPTPADNSLTLTATTPVPVVPAPTPVAPSIRIVQATAAKSGIVTLKVAIKGWSVGLRQAKGVAAASGYWVIYVDGKRNAISRSATTGTTTKLAAGQHRIRAELVGGSGKPLSPPALSNTVVVRVPRRTTRGLGHGRR